MALDLATSAGASQTAAERERSLECEGCSRRTGVVLVGLPARGLRVLGCRLAGPAADLDDPARHRAAGRVRRPAPTVRPEPSRRHTSSASAVSSPVLGRVTDQLGQGPHRCSSAFVVLRHRHRRLVMAVQGGAPTPVPHCSPSRRGRPIRRSAPASGRGGRTCIEDSGSSCTRRTRSRRSSTRSIFMVGPILVTRAGHPGRAGRWDVTVIIAFAVVGGLAFASMRKTAATAAVRSSSVARGSDRVAVLVVIVVVVAPRSAHCSARPRSSRSRSPRSRATAG